MRLCSAGVLAIGTMIIGCGTAPQIAPVVAATPAYIIDVSSNVALHRAFTAEGRTYLEFLDAYRMNPVITGPDGIPLPFKWNQQYVVLEGVHPNLTVTTAHGLAHVYVKQAAPPARVAAPPPAKAAEYGAARSLHQPVDFHPEVTH
jgi:hypothetical protein